MESEALGLTESRLLSSMVESHALTARSFRNEPVMLLNYELRVQITDVLHVHVASDSSP